MDRQQVRGISRCGCEQCRILQISSTWMGQRFVQKERSEWGKRECCQQQPLMKNAFLHWGQYNQCTLILQNPTMVLQRGRWCTRVTLPLLLSNNFWKKFQKRGHGQENVASKITFLQFGILIPENDDLRFLRPSGRLGVFVGNSYLCIGGYTQNATPTGRLGSCNLRGFYRCLGLQKKVHM